MYASELQPERKLQSSEEPRDLISVRPSVPRRSATTGPASLIVVHHNPNSRLQLSELLTLQGYEVTCARSCQEAAAWLLQRPFDIMLCEPSVLSHVGSELSSELGGQYPDMGTIFILGPDTAHLADETLRRGATDFIVPPCNQGELAIVVQRSLTRRSLQQKHSHRYRIGVESSKEGVLDALLSALSTRETEAHGHTERVTAYTMELADRMAIPPGQLYHIERGALLHDIGKIGISDRILQKSSKLTAEEWAEVRKHPVIGYQMCVDIEMLEPAAQIVRHHHERWDGMGYPDRLKAEAIPMGARIFAVADALDGITGDRPYRAARPLSVACEEIARYSGKQFDPAVVRAFLAIPESRWMFIRAHAAR